MQVQAFCSLLYNYIEALTSKSATIKKPSSVSCGGYPCYKHSAMWLQVSRLITNRQTDRQTNRLRVNKDIYNYNQNGPHCMAMFLFYYKLHLHRTESVSVPSHTPSRRAFSAGQLGTWVRWRAWNHYIQHSGLFVLILLMTLYRTKMTVIFCIRGEWSLPVQFNNSPSARLGF